MKALKSNYEQLAKEINNYESQEVIKAKISNLEKEMRELD